MIRFKTTLINIIHLLKHNLTYFIGFNNLSKVIMKLKLLVILTTISAGISAQSLVGISNSDFDFLNQPSTVNTNLGFTQIDNVQYFGIRFQPELSFGKLGFGLDVPLFFSLDGGDIRTEEYTDGVGYFRLINYIKWGKKKKDPLYIRLGNLNHTYLGYGILLNNYSNSVSYEKRKLGLSFDFEIGEKLGLEGIYSDLNPESITLLAFRPYYKPFGNLWTPIVNTIEFGVSYVTDHDQTKSLFKDVTNKFLKNGMNAWAVDVGAFLLNTDFIDWTIFTQYGMLNKIKDKAIVDTIGYINPELQVIGNDYTNGSGLSIGTAARMNIVSETFYLHARLERLWYTDYFIPQFFDIGYEINKDAKLSTLAVSKASQGIYSTLAAEIVDKMIISGSVLLPDNVNSTHPALVLLNINAPDLIKGFVISGSYFKDNILDIKDAFTLDENSQAMLRAAYKILPYFVVGVDYKWSFIMQNSGYLEVDHQIMPYFGLNIPINTNNESI